jgi:flagellar basal-body rod protein FlgF
MNRAIYPILSGAVAQEKQLQVFANNLANVNTAGFKQDQQGFRGLFARASSVGDGRAPYRRIVSTISTRPAGPSERVFAEAHGVRTTFEPGRIRITGNPLDVAIQTDGFFEVKTPNGVGYTRNGIFSLDGQRRLVTNLGQPVMGTKGEIRVPPGNIQINTEGAIQVDGNTIGNIKVVEFPEIATCRRSTRKVCSSVANRPLWTKATASAGAYRGIQRQFVDRNGEDDARHAEL